MELLLTALLTVRMPYVGPPQGQTATLIFYTMLRTEGSPWVVKGGTRMSDGFLAGSNCHRIQALDFVRLAVQEQNVELSELGPWPFFED